MAGIEMLGLVTVCAFYEEGERDPGNMLAQGAATYVPAIGSKVHLRDGKQAGWYLVTDVSYGFHVMFRKELIEWSEQFEAGSVERGNHELEQTAEVFVKRIEPLFDRVPPGFPVE